MCHSRYAGIYNSNTLDFRSEIIKWKIQDGIDIDEECIRGSLTFVIPDDDYILQKFKHNYGELWNHITAARIVIDNDNFDDFAIICARLYVEATLKEQAGILLLFDKVCKKINYDNHHLDSILSAHCRRKH